MATKRTVNNSRAGKGVDSTGGPVVDPSLNVIALSEAATQRQDDLREETTKRIDAGLIHQQDLSNVRDQCARDMADIRERHLKEIRTLESDRLDKIRQVDVLAGNTAADRALVAIQTLATSQAAAAETLRSMVTTTAGTIAAQTAQAMGAVTERIAALEKSSYEGAGKQKVADPMLAELVAEMKIVAKTAATGSGKSEGIKDFAGWIVAALAAGAAIVGFLK